MNGTKVAGVVAGAFWLVGLSWTQRAAAQHLEVPVGISMGATDLDGREVEMLAPSFTLGAVYAEIPWRIGLEGRWVHSSTRDWALEGGLFFQHDVLWLKLDRKRSASIYARGDVGLRYYFDDGNSPTLPTMFSLGLHILGLSAQLGAGPLLEPVTAPAGDRSYEMGWGFDSRVFVDVFGIISSVSSSFK